jgi:hypothetical protein
MPGDVQVTNTIILCKGVQIMKKHISLFIGSCILLILSIFIIANSHQVQAQSNGRQPAFSDPNPATTIITGVSPQDLAGAIGLPPAAIASGAFNGSDLLGFGIGDAPLGTYFPTSGDTFAILSTGLAASADTANISGSLSTILGGLDNSQGDDMTQLSLELNIPPNVNCLSFDFAFYSEEFPEFVGTQYNDTFTAEIGGTNLSIVTNTFGFPEVVAPLNFAFGAVGEIISVNTAFGVFSPTLSTYDGVTPLLRATTPVTPGVTTEVVFTVQDLGDSIYDSAVFIDNFFMSNDVCQSGTGFTPIITSIPPEGGTLIYTNINGQQTSLTFPPGAVPELASITFTPLFSPTHPLNPLQGTGLAIFAGHAFDIEGLLLPEKAYLPFIAGGNQAGTAGRGEAAAAPAIVSSSGLTDTFPLEQPVTIVIEYSDEELADAGINEANLALWLYNEATEQWEDARFTCVPPVFLIDPIANTVTINVCHFTEFSLIG